MSRIDQALKKWERDNHGTVGSERDAAHPSRSSPFHEYESEQPDQELLEEVALPLVTEPPHAARSASVQALAPQRSAWEGSDDLEARLVTSTTNTVSIEQYRRLAAALHEWQIESQHKSVMITSAVPHEGKTLTVVNLAWTLSESYGRRVLVIDADLRAPSVHTLLKIPNDRGLSEALREGHHELCLIEISKRFSVLTAGRPSAAPLAGLTSSRMRDVLNECTARFDWVLIDTSPVGVLPDAQVLTRFVGGVLLVIGAGSTPAAAVSRAIDELGGPEAIIGTVLNGVEKDQIPEAGYYGHYKTSDSQS